MKKIFDEKLYLAENSDVSAAVEARILPSGLHHYLSYGQKEGRKFNLIEMSEMEMLNDQLKTQELHRKIEYLEMMSNIEMASKRVKKDNLVIFYTPRNFEGNLKYAFLEFCKRNEGNVSKCYFLTLSKDVNDQLKEYHLPVLLWEEGDSTVIAKLMKAKLIIDDGFFMLGDPNPRLMVAALAGATRINLMHGTPITKILLDNLLNINFPVDDSFGYLLQNACSNEILFTSSSEDYEFLSSSMIFDEYFVTGYARNDLFHRSPGDLDLINVDLLSMQKLNDGSSNRILYAPTWRIGNHNWIQSSQLNEMRDRLGQIDIDLWVNLHPFEANLNIDFLEKNKINYIKPNTDIYSLLNKFKALVSDYSSISIDFIHAQRSIFLYWNDSEEYFSDRRMLNPKTLERLGVKPIDNLSDLIDEIHEFSKINFPHNCNPKGLHDYIDGRSSERTCIAIEKLLMR